VHTELYVLVEDQLGIASENNSEILMVIATGRNRNPNLPTMSFTPLVFAQVF
jgi:hypothetical protein